MENSVKEEEQQSLKSSPRRRRSTFFERRDSLVSQSLSNAINPNVCSKLSENDQKPNQDLARYFEKLLAEKEQWKTEVKNRCSKYHDLRQEYQLATKAPSRSRISYSALSNEDIEFLKGKVNISSIVENQAILHKRIKETQALYRRAMELDNVILTHCEEKVNEITTYMIDNSIIESIN